MSKPRTSWWRRWRRWVLAMGILAALAPSPIYFYWVRLGLWRNFGEVVPGKVYRSGLPYAKDVRAWHARHGLRSVVNLRGWKEAVPEEAAAAEAARSAGMTILTVQTSARRLPTPEHLRKIIETVESAPQPMLICCRDGSDRTGLVSVIAAMAVGGEDYESAKGEMSAWYCHVNVGRDKVYGVLELYEDHCRRKGASTGGWARFRQWAMAEYDPAEADYPPAGQ